MWYCISFLSDKFANIVYKKLQSVYYEANCGRKWRNGSCLNLIGRFFARALFVDCFVTKRVFFWTRIIHSRLTICKTRNFLT